MAKKKRALGGLFGIAQADCGAKPRLQSQKRRKQAEKKTADTRRMDALYRRLGGPAVITGQALRERWIAWYFAVREQEFARKKRGRRKVSSASGSATDREILKKAKEMASTGEFDFDKALRAVVRDYERVRKLEPGDRTTHLKRIRRLAQASRREVRDRIADALAEFGTQNPI